MATRELVMTFEGASERVRPDRCAVRPLLEVLLAFVDLVEKIGAHEAPYADEAPFVVVMTELRKGSIKNVLGFVPRDGQQNERTAERAGREAARAVPSCLARRDAGPEAIRAQAKHLQRALSRLPADVTAHLHGTVEAPLSELAAAPEAPTTQAVESGDPVAAFDRWYEQAGKPWSKVKDIEQELGRGST